jgi:hypothetical protein
MREKAAVPFSAAALAPLSPNSAPSGSKVQGRSQMGFHLEETPLIKGMLLDWILAGNPVLST